MIDFFSRLDKFMSFKGLNDNKITVMTGISNGLIGKARAGNRGLSLDSISKILDTFPELNANWLLTGVGTMLMTTDNGQNVNIENNKGSVLYADKQAHITQISREQSKMHHADQNHLKEIVDQQARFILQLQEQISSQQNYISELQLKNQSLLDRLYNMIDKTP